MTVKELKEKINSYGKLQQDCQIVLMPDNGKDADYYITDICFVGSHIVIYFEPDM